jgi:hypothetical protein
MTETTPRAVARRSAYDRMVREDRIFALLLEGQSYLDIAEAERLGVRRVRMIVQEALNRWYIDPKKEYALVQIARLENALRLVERKIADGKLNAVSPLIKLVEQLSRFHSEQLEAPSNCPDQHKGALVRLKLERLAATRTAVDARLARLRPIEKSEARRLPLLPQAGEGLAAPARHCTANSPEGDSFLAESNSNR